jgi:hypothetical protein
VSTSSSDCEVEPPPLASANKGVTNATRSRGIDKMPTMQASCASTNTPLAPAVEPSRNVDPPQLKDPTTTTSRRVRANTPLYPRGSVIAVRASLPGKVWFMQLLDDMIEAELKGARARWFEDAGDEPETIYILTIHSDRVVKGNAIQDVTGIIELLDADLDDDFQSYLANVSKLNRTPSKPIHLFKLPEGLMNDLRSQIPLPAALQEEVEERGDGPSIIHTINLRGKGERNDGRPKRKGAGSLLRRLMCPDGHSSTSTSSESASESEHVLRDSVSLAENSIGVEGASQSLGNLGPTTTPRRSTRQRRAGAEDN